MMVIVKLQGGLGNQFFQYAFGKSIAKSCGYHVKFDKTAFINDHTRVYGLDTFKVDIDFATAQELEEFKCIEPTLVLRFARKLFDYNFNKYPANYIDEWYHRINADIFSSQRDFYYEGYWQNIKYFEAYRSEILADLSLSVVLSEKAQSMQQSINTAKCSVGVHVRRGDYITDKENNGHHGILKTDYYYRAFDKIKHLTHGDVTFFIFSDDPCWTKKTFMSSDTVIVPMHADYEDLSLLSLCDHNIIANSSFSWWAAFLNKNKTKIVIAPETWVLKQFVNFQSPQPQDWILL